MPQAPPQRPPGKQAILQAVYEENRAAAAGPCAPAARRRRAGVPGRTRTAARGSLVALLIVALVAVATWGMVLAMDPRTEAAPAALPVATVDEPAPASPPPFVPNAADAGVAEVLGLQVRTIVIDPGHGGRDPGAVGPGGLAEKDVTLDVARRLRDRLVRHEAYQVLMTHEGDRAMRLNERVAFANEAGADLYVSIHVNALADTALAPVETYFFGIEADPNARALAHAENEAGAFSVADFNAAIRRAGTAVKLQESRDLAQSVQRALVEQGRIGPRPRDDWGAKPAPFAVLLHTEAPAVLAEITALSNPTEEARLRTPAYRDAIAAALEAGVLAYLRRSLSPAAD